MNHAAKEPCDIGIIGMGVMGRSLAYQLAEKGRRVAVFDAAAEPLNRAVSGAATLPLTAFTELPDLANSLTPPRKIIVLVPASAVDQVLAQLPPVLSAGDIVLDFGNSHYADTRQREYTLAKSGLRFIGAGISGGEYGARHGACIMGAGDPEVWDVIAPLLKDAAAVARGHVCCARMGPDGAGHFVKMVHNGIEYADMQLISEAYDLMKRLLGMKNEEMADVFSRWNRGPLNSYLIEITGSILQKKDADSGTLVDRILDSAGQKGTGLWTALETLQLGYSSPTLAEAVFARSISAQKELRGIAAGCLPAETAPAPADCEQWLAALENALYVFRLCVYAQGFGLMKAASDAYGWQLPLGEIARIWRGGCIIRAGFLDQLAALFDREPETQNLLLTHELAASLTQGLPHCRRIVADAVMSGIPTPCFSSALSYYDSLRSAVLPANLLQAQRDFFGAHGYYRTDRPGFFHTEWE